MTKKIIPLKKSLIIPLEEKPNTKEPNTKETNTKETNTKETNDIWPTTKDAILSKSSSFNIYRDFFQNTIFRNKPNPEELYRLVHFSSSYSSYAVCKVNGTTDQLSMFIIARGIHERLQKTMIL